MAVAAHRTYVFGNGLSLMFNREYYSLSNLTDRAREALNSIPGLRGEGNTLLTELEEIATGLATDQERRRIRNFEQLAGPLDRLSNVLLEIGPLARLAHTEAQAVIRELWAQLRIQYKRVVGTVLRLVMSHADNRGEWAYLHEIARRLADRCVHQRELDVFTLNYDSLLDAVLVDEERNHRGTRQAFTLMDEFDGRERFQIPVFDPEETLVTLQALAWRTDVYQPSPPVLRLHHLHGAGTWMRYEETVFKAVRLQEMRDSRIYESWGSGIEGQEEAGSVDPVVLLGDQKEASVSQRPFDETYEALIRAVTEASHIVIAGYSFQDLPLNRILREYRRDAQVTVVTTGLASERLKEAFGLPTWRREFPDWLEIETRGLPEGLTMEAVPDLPPPNA